MTCQSFFIVGWGFFVCLGSGFYLWFFCWVFFWGGVVCLWGFVLLWVFGGVFCLVFCGVCLFAFLILNFLIDSSLLNWSMQGTTVLSRPV